MREITLFMIFIFYHFTHAITMPGFGPGEAMIWAPWGTNRLVSLT